MLVSDHENGYFIVMCPFVNNDIGPSFLISLTFIIYLNNKLKYALIVIGEIIINKKSHSKANFRIKKGK